MVLRPVVLATFVVVFGSGGPARSAAAWHAGRTADTLHVAAAIEE